MLDQVLVRLDALFEDDGRWFIAMELVRGQSLLAWSRSDGRCDFERVREETDHLVDELTRVARERGMQ